VTFSIVQAPEGTLDQMGQLIYRAVDGLSQGVGLVSDRDGPVAFEARFHHAAYVVITALLATLTATLLAAVLVAQMNLHPRDVPAEPAQGILHYATDMIGQRFAAFDVMVGIDLGLHDVMFSGCD
jgi:hypothetical protein